MRDQVIQLRFAPLAFDLLCDFVSDTGVLVVFPLGQTNIA